MAPIRAQMKFHNGEDENSTQHSHLGAPLCAHAFPLALMFHFHFWCEVDTRKGKEQTSIITFLGWKDIYLLEQCLANISVDHVNIYCVKKSESSLLVFEHRGMDLLPPTAERLLRLL